MDGEKLLNILAKARNKISAGHCLSVLFIFSKFIYKEVNEKEVDHCVGNTQDAEQAFYLELILCRLVCIRQWEFK